MTRNIIRYRLPLCALLAMTASVSSCAKAADDQADSGAPASTGKAASTRDSSIVVNGVALSATTLQQLQQLYPVPMAPGRYWYDPISGVYGWEGEPVAGQILPGLALGGALAADASRGKSGVFINGRQLTAGEKAYIERICQQPVVLGRYWVMANGVGGYEGQPAFFNLAACPGVPRQNSGPRSMSRTHCDANGACTTSGILGTITTVP